MASMDVEPAQASDRWRLRLPRFGLDRPPAARLERRYLTSVRKDQTVRFEPPDDWTLTHSSPPQGRRQAWVDIFLLRPFGAKVGALMGEVAQTGEVFEIGRGRTKRFDADGDIYAFVNPSPFTLLTHASPDGYAGGGFGATAIPGGAPGGPPPPQRTYWERALRVWDNTHGFPFIAGLLGLACLILAVLPQGQDLVTAIIDSAQASAALGDVALLTVSILFASLEAWFWARRIVVTNYGVDRSVWETGFLGRYLTVGPRVLAFAPFVAVVLTLLFGDGRYWWLATLVAVVGVCALAWLIGRHDAVEALGRGGALRAAVARRLAVRAWRQERLSYLFILSGPPLALASLVWVSVSPAAGLATLNPPTLVFLGLGLMIQPMIVAIQAGHYVRFPTIPALLSLAVLFSLWNDNHQVRPLATASPPPQDRATLEAAFQRWRRQATPAADGSIPLILVATEGGASRAGLWTGEVLGRLEEDSRGAFSRHVFAISSVSGGSVGAVGFAAEVGRPDAAGPSGLTARLRAFTGHNFLSPALGGLLWPDLIARFWPFPARWLPTLPDRATALERGFEVGWDRHCPSPDHGCKGRLSGPFLSLFPVQRDATWVPLIFVNGAHQENGFPVITAPVRLPSGPGRADLPSGSCLPTSETPCAFDAADFYTLDPGEIRASTAIHNGARFPIVSPSGGLGPNGHVIDGGYFDNSGTDTIRQLARALTPQDLEGLRPIVVTIGYEESRATPATSSLPTPRSGPRPQVKNPLRQLVAPWAAKLFPKSEKAGFQRSSVLANDVLGPLKGLVAIKGAHEQQLYAVLKQELNPYDLIADPPRPGWAITRFALCPNLKNEGVSMNWLVSQRGQAVVVDAFDHPDKSTCGPHDSKARRAILEALTAGLGASGGGGANSLANNGKTPSK